MSAESGSLVVAASLLLASATALAGEPGAREPELRAACQAGNARACAAAGGLLAGRDESEAALPLLRKACDAGEPLGCGGLGGLLARRGEASAARPLLTSACEAGEAVACANLGVLLFQAGDRRQAEARLREACTGGSQLGCRHLGDLRQRIAGLKDGPEADDLRCTEGEPAACARRGARLRADPTARGASERPAATHSAGVTLSRATLKSTLARAQPGFAACFDAEQARRWTAKERVKVRFTVGPRGRVRSARAEESTAGDPGLGDCLVGALTLLRFPPTADGRPLEVVYPFAFVAARR